MDDETGSSGWRESGGSPHTGEYFSRRVVFTTLGRPPLWARALGLLVFLAVAAIGVFVFLPVLIALGIIFLAAGAILALVVRVRMALAGRRAGQHDQRENVRVVRRDRE